MMRWFPWFILFLPLAAAGGITLFKLRDRGGSARLSIGAVAMSFLLSLVVFANWPAGGAAQETRVTWLAVGDLQVDLGLRLDALSLLMLLVVTGVGGVIHIYSWGYLRDDPGVPRYYAGLSLFTFAMLGVVLANNFVLLFLFWELVGLSSYLLIGFWFDKPAAADAAKKAFLTTRLGDFGFLLGILLIWAALGSVHFATLAAKLSANPHALWTLTTIAGLLIFCGAMGKSAQFPLHVWLPDAMEGPTPVSALIHAATMVAAGVFMLCRVYFLFTAEPRWPDDWAWLSFSALDFIAWIGGITALLAALLAVQQDDIKRILAYSTLSQLGYMIMAVGLNGPTPAMFHLTTHAFFKALLFLGAGSVIVALHHEQNIWRMGGLRRKMPVTYWTFLAGTLALCGVPPFSGFFSKDAVLATAYLHNKPLFGVAVLVAFLTTFYMFRLVFVVFTAHERSPAAKHAAESPAILTLPLLALAVPSLLAGFWGIERWLGQVFPPGGAGEVTGWWGQMVAPFAQSPAAAYGGLAAVLAGIGLATLSYHAAAHDPLPARLGEIARAMRRRFYIDELYARIIALTLEAAARVADWIDRWIVAGVLVRGTHGSFELAGRVLRLTQNGNVQTYAWLLVCGMALILFWVLRH